MVEGLLRSLKQFKIGRKDMGHSLPDVELYDAADGIAAFCETPRVVQEDLVLSHVE